MATELIEKRKKTISVNILGELNFFGLTSAIIKCTTLQLMPKCWQN